MSDRCISKQIARRPSRAIGRGPATRRRSGADQEAPKSKWLSPIAVADVAVVQAQVGQLPEGPMKVLSSAQVAQVINKMGARIALQAAPST